jgi:hypothetical protein
MAGRLIPAAKYRPEDFDTALRHDCEAAALIGDEHTLDYLREQMGAGHVGLADQIRKNNSTWIINAISSSIVSEDDPNERAKLELLLRLYEGLPKELRASERVDGDFRSQLGSILYTKA